jgi:hypothetical protein
MAGKPKARRRNTKARRQRLEPGRAREIVREIIAILGTKERAQVAAVIRGSFRFHQGYGNLFARKGHEARISSAKRISKYTTALESELKAAPALLLDFAFQPPALPHHPSDVDLDDHVAAPRRQRLATLYLLRLLRAACEKFLADGAGAERVHGPELDRDQRHSATVAFLLMARFSAKPITGSDDGPYRVITGLLYELVTGRENVDLRRHCYWVIRHPPDHVQVSEVDAD